MKKEKYDTTWRIEYALNRVILWEKILSEFNSPSRWFFRRIDRHLIKQVIEDLAEARTALNRIIIEEYPQLKGKDFSVNNSYITETK